MAKKKGKAGKKKLGMKDLKATKGGSVKGGMTSMSRLNK
jgi:hypothetical protein